MVGERVTETLCEGRLGSILSSLRKETGWCRSSNRLSFPELHDLSRELRNQEREDEKA